MGTCEATCIIVICTSRGGIHMRNVCVFNVCFCIAYTMGKKIQQNITSDQEQMTYSAASSNCSDLLFAITSSLRLVTTVFASKHFGHFLENRVSV